jgi:hypothetical protein
VLRVLVLNLVPQVLRCPSPLADFAIIRQRFHRQAEMPGLLKFRSSVCLSDSTKVMQRSSYCLRHRRLRPIGPFPFVDEREMRLEDTQSRWLSRSEGQSCKTSGRMVVVKSKMKLESYCSSPNPTVTPELIIILSISYQYLINILSLSYHYLIIILSSIFRCLQLHNFKPRVVPAIILSKTHTFLCPSLTAERGRISVEPQPVAERPAPKI